MNELININYDNYNPTVNGRELHKALEVKTAYKDWFPRMCEYGFTEGKDFCSKMSKSTGGRPSVDHQLTIPMAKEICMIQRNDKGKMFRQYFIQIEEAWNDPKAILARALQFTQNQLELVKNQNFLLNRKIEQDKPLVAFAEQISDTTDLIDIGAYAKLLKKKHVKIGRNTLFEWLRNNGYLRANNEPYQQYINQGYFKTKEYTYIVEGEPKIGIKTYVTGKGQQYLYNKLSALGM